MFAMRHYTGNGPLNLGGGRDTSIAELAMRSRGRRISRESFDSTPRSLTECPSRHSTHQNFEHSGWRPSVSFGDALERTYRWFLNHEAQLVQRGAN